MKTANVKPIQKHQAVEVKITSVSLSQVKFPDVQTLRRKKIVGIEVQHVNEVTNAPSGLALISDTVFKKTFITLKNCHNADDIDKLPLNAIYAKNNNGNVKYFNEMVLDFANSYITISETTGLTADTVVLLDIYYED